MQFYLPLDFTGAIPRYCTMKSFSLLFAIFALLAPVLALEVDEEEIKSKSGIEFINGSGRRGTDTEAAIKGIGKEMAEDGRYGAYSVIHAVGKGDDKFDADIIVIGANARVNHIKNIRRIIEGYLVEKYEYSAEDAKSLALFVTYYNGFYRKNLGYFKEHYKPEVTRHLSAANAGLDRKYTGWPGKSRIVIPLSDDEKPDAGKIGEKEVMDKVRKDEKGTKDRENMTKIQEKELKRKEDKNRKERDDLNKRKDDIAKREDRVKEEKRQNEDNPDPKDKAKKDEEIKKKEDELNKEKEVAKKDEEKLNKNEQKVEEKKTEIAQNKQNIQADNKAERKNETPAQREQRLDAQEKQLKENRPQDGIFGGKLYYLRVRDFSTDGKYRNDFYIIDPANRKVRVKSPYGGIVGKKFDVVDKDVVVIGEKKSAAGVISHYLVLLDGETLVDKSYGSDEVFWRGFVEVRENEIYAIVNKNGSYYLGKFDKSLNLLQRSEVQLHEDTFFSFYENTIYVNGADRKIEVLNKADLKAVGNIVP